MCRILFMCKGGAGPLGPLWGAVLLREALSRAAGWSPGRPEPWRDGGTRLMGEGMTNTDPRGRELTRFEFDTFFEPERRVASCVFKIKHREL